MNCDEFLEALESPDERRRTAARRHANSCPSCAALAEVHAQLQQELGRPEPLPPESEHSSRAVIPLDHDIALDLTCEVSFDLLDREGGSQEDTALGSSPVELRGDDEW